MSNSTKNQCSAHSVNLKITSHEKAKITVCLAATAIGGKKKTFLCLKVLKEKSNC